LQACGSYKQNIMFQPETDQLLNEITLAEKTPENYIIQPNDYLEIEVFTKKGEFLIDPENRLIDQQIPNNANLKPELQYLVQTDGSVVLPMVGQINLADKTLLEAENELIVAYEKYYKDPFVKLRYVNKRVIILGGAGGRVVPLTNENTTVVEVLALVEGFEEEAKSHNIRLLRGEKAFLIDFSTIKGYAENNMIVQNGDVIYVEPVRRPFSEFIRDNGPVISVFSSLASLIAVVISLN
ncbi:polysaccharide export protein EpsE, partial [Fulvivirga sp. RKSG066]|uniref:polysaccharide biosynthesis/export family protein n=1 Tax=Fulvivirga aurantia TaxID=2529383 RepID=UPI0012BCDD3C